LHCGVDPDLIDLATRCLSAAPSQRPASAQMLAKAMHEHLVGAEARIQDARVKAAESRARASSLRRMQRLGIATTLFFAIGLGISLWFWHSADEQRGIADQAAQEANRSEIRARAAQSESERNLNNFDRLSHIVRLRKARAVERELYPAWPAQTAAMRNWIEGQASEITAAVPELRSTLSGLEGRTDPAAMFLRDALIGLVAEIEQFRAHEKAGVAQRLAWSERVEDLTVERHEKSWSEARAAISAADGIRASKLYSQHPIDLTPQMGLIPIGMNPVTKLWEFYHLRSAWDPQSETQASALELPSFDEQGEFDMNGRGIIFVLIPGGSFDMGAQSSDRSYVNFDPQAKNHERAVHRVELAPFFIAKHEMTRGQWARLSGGDTPSSEPIGTEQPGSAPAIRDSHPVEQVSWEMCRELLSAHGLLLPTESQWEYACRAGTTTPYSSGDTAASLEGFANVLDLSAAAEPSPLTGGDPFRDGFKFLAPVGSFRPNAFGLHDMHGNLAEWCRDRFGGYGHRARPGDALREPGPACGGYVIRGGNFLMPGRFARSADRTQLAPSTLANYRGLRPVRPLLE
jgi:sulfatase modifying factor 1